MVTKGRVASVVVLLLLIAAGGHLARKRWDERSRAAAAAALFAPFASNLSDRAVFGVEVPGGSEIVVEIGLTLSDLVRDSGDWRAFIARSSELSYDSLMPSVAAAALRLVRTLEALHADQEGAIADLTWSLTRELFLSMHGFVQVTAEAQTLRVKVDAADAARRVSAIVGDARYGAIRGLREVEQSLVRDLLALATVAAAALETWDGAALARDRALAALAASDWTETRDAARTALRIDSHDDTSALAGALALVESAPQGDVSQVRSELDQLLEPVERRGTARSDTAALLRAIAAMKTGATGAREKFESLVAAARGANGVEAPGTRADALRYKLRPTADVEASTRQLAAMRGGGGAFSAPLQFARLASGEETLGELRRAFLVHFNDRVARGAFAALPADLEFCRRMLGASFIAAFPEEAFLDLSARPVEGTSRVSLSLRNGSGRAAAQAVLVVFARYAGMVPGDVIVRPAGVRPLDAVGEADFGELDLAASADGKAVGPAELSGLGALVVTEDLVAFVEAEGTWTGQPGLLRARPASLETALRQALGLIDGRVAAALAEQAKLSVDEEEQEALRIELPEALTTLRPVFRLMRGDRELAPSQRLQSGDRYVLRFAKAAAMLRGKGAGVVLRVSSPLASWNLHWKPAPAGGWMAKSVEEVR